MNLWRVSHTRDRRWGDGTTLENFDAGPMDADGRISLLLTFAGVLDESGKRKAEQRRPRRVASTTPPLFSFHSLAPVFHRRTRCAMAARSGSESLSVGARRT
jgi:hypothetical protein